MIGNVILKKLPLNQQKYILLRDPDDMVSGEEIISLINGFGYTVLNYEDPDMFRYYFEKNVRKYTDIEDIDNGGIILRLTHCTYVPYDIQCFFEEIAISLRDIFPKLSYAVLKEMDEIILDDIYKVYSKYEGRDLNESETIDYILNNVFEIFPDYIHTYGDLVKTLLKIYYRRKELPEIIQNYLLLKLTALPGFEEKPLKSIISGKEYFFHYLQQQWEQYIESFSETDVKIDVDFNHADIRVYMDNLFLEGLLMPVPCSTIEKLPQWARSGIIYDEFSEKKKSYQDALEAVRNSIQNIRSFRDWSNIAYRWAEALVISNDISVKKDLDLAEFEKTALNLERSFKEWLLKNYGLLASLSYVGFPVMVHHIPWHIHYKMRKANVEKAALIVIDGMSLDNWIIVKKHLLESRVWILEEHFSFAWIPTMTYISRQAIFSGQIPAYFADTLFSTDNDEKHWKRFWMNRGFREDSIYYIRNIKYFNEAGLDEMTKSPNAKILGIVVNMIDDMLHGEQLLLTGMHQNIKLWLKEGGLERLLNDLSENGFEIYITSDHGNIMAIGQGNVKEGLGVDKTGSRVRIYEKSKSYENVILSSKAFKWKGFGLPPEYNYIICDDNYAYGNNSEKLICHGGTSIEEVIVPFVHIRKGESYYANSRI